MAGGKGEGSTGLNERRGEGSQWMQCDYCPAVALFQLLFDEISLSSSCICLSKSGTNPKPQKYYFTLDEVSLIKAASHGLINGKHQLGLLMRDN